MFEVFLHNQVTKKLKKLDKTYLKRFAELTELLEKDPYPWKNFDLKKIKNLWIYLSFLSDSKIHYLSIFEFKIFRYILCYQMIC